MLRKCCCYSGEKRVLICSGEVNVALLLWGGKCCSGEAMLLGGEKLLCSGEVNVALLLWGGKCCLGERSCYALGR
ncbi:MAG TPA: hypothetical protein P5543_10910 [Planctomycetota bacterium]|nr:hypothetical protein [Planctomycetota bacterium]HRU52687.1 hypothetical protein [Planctomycetota bacterium]